MYVGDSSGSRSGSGSGSNSGCASITARTRLELQTIIQDPLAYLPYSGFNSFSPLSLSLPTSIYLYVHYIIVRLRREQPTSTNTSLFSRVSNQIVDDIQLDTMHAGPSKFTSTTNKRFPLIRTERITEMHEMDIVFSRKKKTTKPRVILSNFTLPKNIRPIIT